MAAWLDDVKKELAKRMAVGYYSGGPDSYLERKRGSILSSMDAGGIGTADTEERRRQARMAEAPEFFPAYELQRQFMSDLEDKTEGVTWLGGDAPGNLAADMSLNVPMLDPTTGKPIRSKPKFVVGQLSGPRLSQYIGQAADKLAKDNTSDSNYAWLNSRADDWLPTSLQGQAYNWLADPIKRLAEGQVLLVNNFQQAHPTGANHLAVVKDNGLVTQRLLTDEELKPYQNAMRSGLPISIPEQLQDDFNSSPSQYGRTLWDRVVAAAPDGALRANQMTLYPTGFSGAAGYVSNVVSPSDIYLAYESRSDPFVMAHESGHMISAGDDGLWNQDFRDALAADAQRQAQNPNKFANYENRYRSGFTPGLTTVSDYGATNPQEAWGDLYGMFAAEGATNRPAFRRGEQEMTFADMYPQTNRWIRNLANLQLSYWPEPVIR